MFDVYTLVMLNHDERYGSIKLNNLTSNNNKNTDHKPNSPFCHISISKRERCPVACFDVDRKGGWWAWSDFPNLLVTF